jgi:hypothetical protein
MFISYSTRLGGSLSYLTASIVLRFVLLFCIFFLDIAPFLRANLVDLAYPPKPAVCGFGQKRAQSDPTYPCDLQIPSFSRQTKGNLHIARGIGRGTRKFPRRPQKIPTTDTMRRCHVVDACKMHL